MGSWLVALVVSLAVRFGLMMIVDVPRDSRPRGDSGLGDISGGWDGGHHGGGHHGGGEFGGAVLGVDRVDVAASDVTISPCQYTMPARLLGRLRVHTGARLPTRHATTAFPTLATRRVGVNTTPPTPPNGIAGAQLLSRPVRASSTAMLCRVPPSMRVKRPIRTRSFPRAAPENTAPGPIDAWNDRSTVPSGRTCTIERAPPATVRRPTMYRPCVPSGIRALGRVTEPSLTNAVSSAPVVALNARTPASAAATPTQPSDATRIAARESRRARGGRRLTASR
jgi:hypothetical protein